MFGYNFYLLYNTTIIKGETMKLILLRHGQSEWNLQNRFTGWTDVDITEKGKQEALNAAKHIKDNNIKIDVVFNSVLKRALSTYDIINKELGLNIEPIKSWKLNERHYGALQGLNKKETADIHGEEQVHLWRRSANTRPPLLKADDKRNPAFDTLYSDVDKSLLPLGESLNDTAVRVEQYYNQAIVPVLKQDKNVLVSAHGNSLRALVKILENVDDKDIMSIEIPTGKLIVYDLDDNLNIIDKQVL